MHLLVIVVSSILMFSCIRQIYGSLHVPDTMDAFLSLLEQQYEQNVSNYNIISKMIHFYSKPRTINETHKGVEMCLCNINLIVSD